jgi:hypothetical protein
MISPAHTPRAWPLLVLLLLLSALLIFSLIMFSG